LARAQLHGDLDHRPMGGFAMKLLVPDELWQRIEPLLQGKRITRPPK
jgi:hypothetical protein